VTPPLCTVPTLAEFRHQGSPHGSLLPAPCSLRPKGVLQGSLSLTNPASGTSLSRLPGAVAQLGERCNRTAEVRGSIPLSSMVGGQTDRRTGGQPVRLRAGDGDPEPPEPHTLGQSDGQHPPAPRSLLPAPCSPLPLGVTGNTPDSGSGESWFEPRRGNSRRRPIHGRRFLFPVACPDTAFARPG
jgi:hypothetical protein